MNETLRLLHDRFSTRAYARTPLTDEERAAILAATMRAPTAGNMMLYSIVEIRDQALKEKLAVTCDDQPFIAKAPWVLLFAADLQKWTDLFAVSGVERVKGVEPRHAPGAGDLLLACCDALIAAHTAVVAAESLGIGSCYIGDVMEQGETHAELLGLPPHTFPVAMLCFGRPAKRRRPTPHVTSDMVHVDRYHRMSRGELEAREDELRQTLGPRRLPAGVDNYGQYVYRRKFAAGFTHELNRSVDWWLARWRAASFTSAGDGGEASTDA
jgi:nitroreductase